jgi:hypothetical protein
VDANEVERGRNKNNGIDALNCRLEHGWHHLDNGVSELKETEHDVYLSGEVFEAPIWFVFRVNAIELDEGLSRQDGFVWLHLKRCGYALAQRLLEL